MGEVGLADRVEKQVAGYGDAAAENEDLGVQHRAERCAGLAEPGAEIAQRLQRARVARDDELCDIGSGEGASLLPYGGEPETDAADICDLVGHAQ